MSMLYVSLEENKKTECCIELGLYLFKDLPVIPHILEVNVWHSVLEWEHLVKFLGGEMSV